MKPTQTTAAAAPAKHAREFDPGLPDYQRLFLQLRAHPITEPLTPREEMVLARVAWTDKQIAASLGISARTVNGHLRRSYKKLGARCRTEAALMFIILKMAR